MPDEEGDERKAGAQILPVHISETVIPPLAVVQGTIQADDDVRVDGVYEGPIDTRGRLVIGRHGRVLGDVVAHRVSIAGALKGDVAAYHVDVLGTGRVWGDLKVHSFELLSGGVVDGRIIMDTDASASEVFGELEPIAPPSLKPAPPPEPALSLRRQPHPQARPPDRCAGYGPTGSLSPCWRWWLWEPI